MIYLIVWVVSVVLWCIGGQVWKGARRYVLPLFYFGTLFLTKKEKKDKIKSISILSMIGTNSMGYGKNSRIMQMLNNEILVRALYAAISCLPFVFLLTPFQFLISSILIIFAFQLRLGALKIGKYDLLFEDVVRSSAIALAVSLAITNAK